MIARQNSANDRETPLPSSHTWVPRTAADVEQLYDAAEREFEQRGENAAQGGRAVVAGPEHEPDPSLFDIHTSMGTSNAVSSKGGDDSVSVEVSS